MDRPLSPPANPPKIDQLRTLARELVSPSSRFEPFIPGHRPTMHETLTVLGALSRWTEASLAPLLQALLPPPPASAAPPADPAAPAARSTARPTASHASAPQTPRPPERRAGIGASALAQGAGTPIGDPSLSRSASARADYPAALKNPSLVQALLALHARNQAPRRPQIIKASAPRPEAPSFTAAVPPPSAAPPNPNGPRFSGADFLIEDLPWVDAVSKPGPAVRANSATHSILRSAEDAGLEND